jgi:hypothetical protein
MAFFSGNTQLNKPAKPTPTPKKERKARADKGVKRGKNILNSNNSFGPSEVDNNQNNATSLVIVPDSYYIVDFCGQRELVLTNYNGKGFYIYGDEFCRTIDRATFIKKIDIDLS